MVVGLCACVLAHVFVYLCVRLCGLLFVCFCLCCACGVVLRFLSMIVWLSVYSDFVFAYVSVVCVFGCVCVVAHMLLFAFCGNICLFVFVFSHVYICVLCVFCAVVRLCVCVYANVLICLRVLFRCLFLCLCVCSCVCLRVWLSVCLHLYVYSVFMCLCV